MLQVFKSRPTVVIEAQKAKFNPNIVIQLLVFIAVFIVTQIAVSIPIFIPVVVRTVQAMLANQLDMSNADAINRFTAELQNSMVLPSLFCTVICTVLVIVFCRQIEKRSLYSMGFVKQKAISDYLIGLLIGFVMFGTCVLITVVSGGLVYNGFVLGNGLGLLIAFFVGFLLQGMSEEVTLRGYLMISIASKKSILLAVLANSILFAMMHLFNSGISPLAFVNLILYGVFSSIYVLKMDSIWGACAIHSMWNFVQGNVFGIKVSGMETSVTMFRFSSTNGSTLFNGGAFGLEGGLAVTIVLVVGIFVLMLIKGRGIEQQKSELFEQPQNEVVQ